MDPTPVLVAIAWLTLGILRFRHRPRDADAAANTFSDGLQGRRGLAELREALQSPDPRLRIAAAIALGDEGTATLIDLAGNTETEVAVCTHAITVLGTKLPIEGSVSPAEPCLLAALKSDDGRVQVAAAEALGRAGSIAAVSALRAALLRTGPGHISFPHAVQQAIATIQSRVASASPGQISLAEGDGGRVSLASDDHVGAVTISSEKSRAP